MSWKSKLSCKLLPFRIKIFLLILIVNNALDEVTAMPDSIESTTETQSTHDKSVRKSRQVDFNNIEAENDYYPNYPYEKLRELVEETKRILNSSNATEKQLLNFHPSYYESYLRSANLNDHTPRSDTDVYISKSYILHSEDHPPPMVIFPAMAAFPQIESPTSRGCSIVFEVHKPVHLKSIDGTHQLIINLGDQFVQEWNTTKCAQPNKQCGSSGILPEMYESVCEQNYSGTVRFFSVPVGEEITISKQGLREFKVPDGCNCKLRPTSMRYF